MGDFFPYNNGEIELPNSVQQMINQICKKERKDPPDDKVRRLLLAIGEEPSLCILKEISKYQIKKTLSAFIVFMAKKYYQSETQQFYQKQNYEEPVPSPEESRLARVCAGLSPRIQEYKFENAQLEELRVAERELRKSCEARIKQLQKDLSAAKKKVSRAESSLAEALAAKDSEIEALVSSTDALKKQAAVSEGNLASLQANMDSLMRNRELTETRMMQALREELGAAERRLKEECAAHNATKKVCGGLSSRIQEYKSENAQLEELLVAERELSKSCEALIKQLQKDLSAAKKEVSRAESSMVEALAAKNAEIDALVSSMDALKKQAALSEGNLASLQALREELGAAERRSEEECAAHNATKKVFMEREVELEDRALEASTALARAQRTADESTAKATELEQKVALLEVECAKLNQELQDMEALKKSSEEANQVLQLQTLQEEMERARQGQREAESKLASLEDCSCDQQVSGSSEGTEAGESKSAGDRLGRISKERAKKSKKRNLGWGALLPRRPRPQITEEQIGHTAGSLRQRHFPKISVLAQCCRAVPGLPRRKSKFLKEV